METLGILNTQEPREAGRALDIRPQEPRQNKAADNKEEPDAPEQPRVDSEEAIRVEREKIERIAEAMDNYVDSVQRDLKIQVHEKTGNIVVKVISKSNGKVIREIPPEEMLNLAARMEEMLGALFNESI